MDAEVLVILLICITCGSAAKLCTSKNIQLVARVVFGEARGEPKKGQLAVAFTIVNRVNHAGYPNTVRAVVHQTYRSGTRLYHQYNTLDVASHDRAWKNTKGRNSVTYKNAVRAAKGALCKEKSLDPTSCATDFCAKDPCSATRSNKYWTATNKQKIGNHYFVCKEKARG